jgi:predicted CXXCH cytochrome family protein
MDVRNCESCHSAATSGSWKTKPGRLACMGCHDTDAATIHMTLPTDDPTPTAPWSGDEQESCAACH